MSNAVTIPSIDDLPFFKLCRSDPNVTQLFGARPLRIYPFGEAPEGTATPFATYQTSFTPENSLNDRPDVDRVTLQIDVYAETGALCRSGAQNIIAAIECEAYVGTSTEIREPETRDFRITTTAEFIVERKTR